MKALAKFGEKCYGEKSYLIEYISLENIENVIFKFNFLPKNFTAITDFETSCASASEF